MRLLRRTKTAPRGVTRSYPYNDGDHIILGPQTFTDRTEQVINWKGENYYRGDASQGSESPSVRYHTAEAAAEYPHFKSEPDPIGGAGVTEQVIDVQRPADSAFLLDPSDPFERVVIEAVELNRRKRADYSAGDNPWQNFYDGARQINDTAGKAIEGLIANKQARLRTLLFVEGKKPNNESIRDTLMDRTVYSIIGVDIYDRGDY